MSDINSRQGRQLRSTPQQFCTRDDGNDLVIEGYFAVFDSPYVLWDGATEIVKPGAFAGCLSGDIRALIDHDTRLVLGRTKAGTLTLREDARGLYGTIKINRDDADAMRLYARVQRGDVLAGKKFVALGVGHAVKTAAGIAARGVGRHSVVCSSLSVMCGVGVGCAAGLGGVGFGGLDLLGQARGIRLGGLDVCRHLVAVRLKLTDRRLAGGALVVGLGRLDVCGQLALASLQRRSLLTQLCKRRVDGGQLIAQQQYFKCHGCLLLSVWFSSWFSTPRPAGAGSRRDPHGGL